MERMKKDRFQGHDSLRPYGQVNLQILLMTFARLVSLLTTALVMK
jgi:hypothetical protein